MKSIVTSAVTGLIIVVGGGTTFAQQQEQSVEEVAKELSNPAGSLASLNFNLQYQTFKGNLPDANGQDSGSFLFQPTLPFPVGNQGRRVIFRPAVPVPFDQPIFVSDKGQFNSADVNLADITFDLVYAGNAMLTSQEGYLWGIGGAGTLPTATDDQLGGEQWRLGPEVFGGIILTWGLMGALVSHQWDIGGSNDESFSTTTTQYFYAYGLGDGWQIAASPVITYDWKADSGEAWTVPLGIGAAKTTKIGNTPWKFAFQAQYYVDQPDTFGAEWLLKLTITPVIDNPFL